MKQKQIKNFWLIDQTFCTFCKNSNLIWSNLILRRSFSIQILMPIIRIFILFVVFTTIIHRTTLLTHPRQYIHHYSQHTRDYMINDLCELSSGKIVQIKQNSPLTVRKCELKLTYTNVNYAMLFRGNKVVGGIRSKYRLEKGKTTPGARFRCEVN